MCTTCMSLRPWDEECIYNTMAERANVAEGIDAAASTATIYTIGEGDTFNGAYGFTIDTDWVRVSLVAGATYTFTLEGIEPIDAYLYLRDASGIVITENDDGAGGLNARIIYTASTSGSYYLEASQFALPENPGDLGNYALSVAREATSYPVWTTEEMADQLINGYWQYGGQSSRSFAVAAGGTITVNLSELTPTMRPLAERALLAWTETTGLVFNEVSTEAMIDFTYASDVVGPEAYANSTIDWAGNILSASVNIDQEWLDSQGTTLQSYTFQTYIHEIGHALGLGHAGNYNGDATFGVSNSALNDSWQLSVMSYLDQQENTSVNGTRAYTITPMLADILAISQLYGLTNTLRSGNTTYGENSNAGDNYAMFSQYNNDADEFTTLTMTIIDSGGADTLDFRSDTENQRIDMRSQAASDVYGDVGTLVIASGTVIENLIAGSGNDVLIGNSAANTIDGNDGNDSIVGGAGNDYLNGGAGRDSLQGENGSDWITPGAGADTVEGGDGVDMVSFVDATVRAVIDLVAGTAVIGAETDVLSGIENITATIFADLITGDAGANRIRALGDYDWMVGSGGGDTFEGGTGRDTVAYSSATSGVWASLLSDTGSVGQATGDTYLDVENLTGSSHADRLTGDNDRNILRGLGGDDFIFANGGNDTIDGGAGRDFIDGGAQNDRITGGRGNDTIDGGYGWDTAIYSGTRAQYSVTGNPDGTTTIIHNGGGSDGIDLLLNIEVLQFSDGRLFL